MPYKTVLKAARRAIILVVGGTVILIGIALLLLPGQGLLTILAGLAILGTEFVWAKRLLNRIRQSGQDVIRILGKKYHRDPNASESLKEKEGEQE
jgi:uncharacterized protein (TIGR02611 family)